MHADRRYRSTLWCVAFVEAHPERLFKSKDLHSATRRIVRFWQRISGDHSISLFTYPSNFDPVHRFFPLKNKKPHAAKQHAAHIGTSGSGKAAGTQCRQDKSLSNHLRQRARKQPGSGSAPWRCLCRKPDRRTAELLCEPYRNGSTCSSGVRRNYRRSASRRRTDCCNTAFRRIDQQLLITCNSVPKPCMKRSSSGVPRSE